MSAADWHDLVFLRFLQAGVYAHPMMSVAVWWGALFALPAHRWLACVVRWCFLITALILLGFYNAWREAPLLGCFLWTAIGYLWLRWMLWRLPQRLAGIRLSPGWGWFRPALGWTSRIVRDYFRADPRGVYWLDLARAVRGIPLARTAAERRAMVAGTRRRKGIGKAFWHAFFGLVEARIRLYRALPAYWHQPRSRSRAGGAGGDLALDEPHTRGILEQERLAAFQKMLEVWTAGSFAAYCRRDSKTRHEAAGQAALWHQKSILHAEALVESSTYRTPWEAGEKGLMQAAGQLLEIWRERRQYDFLITPRALRESDGHVASYRAPDADGQEAPRETSGQPAPGEEQVRGELGVREDPDIPAPVSDSAPAADADAEPNSEDTADDPLFRRASPAESELSSAGRTASTKPIHDGLSFRESARLGDLEWASRLLEAYLGITSCGDFARDRDCVEPFLDQPKRVTGAVMLLLIYCLRPDYRGRTTDRQKVDLIGRLNERFQQAPDQKVFQDAKRILRSLHFDWLADWGDYSQLRGRLAEREQQTPYEWRLLADTVAALAEQLSDQPELRDILRRDAIDYYFQAGFRGLWTLEVASRVLGRLNGMEELLDLLRTHAVELLPSERLSVGKRRAAAGVLTGKGDSKQKSTA